MKANNLLNPRYVYQRRDRIVPYLRLHINQLAHRASNALGIMTPNDRRLASLKDLHKGQRAFVIGNGPSLRISDLDRLKGEITIAANKIYLAFDYTDWRPTYYNVEDELVIQQNYKAINSLEGFTKLLRWLPNGLLSRNKDTIFYEMHWLHLMPSAKYHDFSPSPLHGLFCGCSVTYTSLQFLYFMGITEIYLIGVDFTFLIPNVDESGYIISQGEVNHFLPNYHKEDELWITPHLDLQEQAFVYGRDYCEARGVKIFNATRGGKLEVFPRVDFDRLFE